MLVDGEEVAARGGGLLTKLFGGGWPDPDEVVKTIASRQQEDPS